MAECSICCSKLRDINKIVSATFCGHLYHYDCILQWLQRSQTCPQCLRFTNPTQVFQIFLPDDETKNTEILIKGINDLKISFGKTERAIEENKNIIHQQQLCLNNLLELNRELLTKITAISKKIETIGESGNVNELEDQIKSKDIVIKNLTTDIQNLKLERLEGTKQLEEIKKQVAELKKLQAKNGEGIKNNALKPVNIEQSYPKTMSLKFDDVSDRLIIDN